MNHPTLLKLSRCLGRGKLAHFPSASKVQDRHLRAKQRLPASSNAGFTMIELIVVVIMIAILSAIAAPGWLAFVNRQRVSKVSDAVSSAIQTAQQEAKSKKVSYSVSFYTPLDGVLKGIPQVAIYPADSSPNWTNLSNNLEIKPNQVILGTNLVGTSTKEPYITTKYSSINYTPESTSTNHTQKLTFDYRGSLPIGADTNLAVVVAVPQSTSSIQPIPDTKRCVIVATLLGSMRIGKGEYNATSNPQGCP